MAWDIATAETKIPAPPAGTPPQTALITQLMDTAISIAERYCDRKFLRKQEQIRFYDIAQETVQLPRWPVVSIDASTPSNLGKHHVHRGAGQIKFHGQRFFDELDITYTGGYDPLPADLEMALWNIFMTLWDTYGSGSGGGGPTIALGAVKRKTIVNVGSIEYETGSAASSDSDSAADWSSLMPGATRTILNLYRREYV